MIESLDLHGREEITNFFKDEPEGKKNIDDFVNLLLSYPNGFTLGLPSYYVVDGQEIFVHRRTQEVVIFHT